MVLPECGEEAPPGLNVSTIYNEVDKELDFGVLSAENGLFARAYKVCWCQLAPARGHYCDAASESLGFFRLYPFITFFKTLSPKPYHVGETAHVQVPSRDWKCEIPMFTSFCRQRPRWHLRAMPHDVSDCWRLGWNAVRPRWRPFLADYTVVFGRIVAARRSSQAKARTNA